MRWFVQRVVLLLLLVGLALGAVYYFILLRPAEFIGVLQPRVAGAQGLEHWEVELRASGESIRLLERALDPARGKETLDVEFSLRAAPTQPFKGKLSRDRIRVAESRASVRIHAVNDDIPAEHRVPENLLTPGVEAFTRVYIR